MKQEQNEESIKNLRKKNKHLIARLKAVKVGALDATSQFDLHHTAVDHCDQRKCK